MARLPGNRILNQDPARDEGVPVTRSRFELLILGLPAEDQQRTVRELIGQVARSPDVSVLDAVLVVMSAGAVARTREIIGTGYDPGLRTATPGLISNADVTEIGAILAPDGDAVAVLLEHVWVERLAASAERHRGRWVAAVPVPADHVRAAQLAQPGVPDPGVVGSGGAAP